MVLRSTLAKSIKNKCYLNGQCFLFQTAEVNWNPAEIGQHPCSLDEAVCHQNVEKEANLILSCASISPPMEQQTEQTQGGRGDEEGVGDEEVGWGLTQNQLQ